MLFAFRTKTRVLSPNFVLKKAVEYDKMNLQVIRRHVMKIEYSSVPTNFNGERCYVHARGAFRADGFGLMTMQKLELSGSDLFYGIEFMTSGDFGRSFSEPRCSDGLVRRYFSDGTSEVLCDATPFYHKKTGRFLLVGHLATYEGDRGTTRRKSTAYAVFDEERSDFSSFKMIDMPPEEKKYFCAGSGCSQIWEEDGGEVLIPFYFCTEENRGRYSVAIMRCAFDGKELSLLEIGNDVTVGEARGLCEPSIVKFGDGYFLALRNDLTGYIAASRDGVHIDEPVPLCFDDGESLGNYNTQQHWLVGGGRLWLVYTRRAENNGHVFRHRAPLFIAEFDPATMRVIRATERIAVPERGARLGNFGCQSYSDELGYVFAAEWMQGDNGLAGCTKYGSDNSIFVSRVNFKE